MQLGKHVEMLDSSHGSEECSVISLINQMPLLEL